MTELKKQAKASLSYLKRRKKMLTAKLGKINEYRDVEINQKIFDTTAQIGNVERWLAKN